MSDISATMGSAREYDLKEEIFCKVRESTILYSLCIKIQKRLICWYGGSICVLSVLISIDIFLICGSYAQLL